MNAEEISGIAGCSFHFFQKVFSYMNGISFSEYIRCRKMTLAGYDLKSTNKKVIDLSYKYGYDSPTSFTKAFRQFHGVSPKEARSGAAVLRVFPKMTLSAPQRYQWKLIAKGPTRLIGKCRRVSCAGDALKTEIPAFWSDCQRDGVFSRLISMDAGKSGLFGVFGAYDEPSNTMEYFIMAPSTEALPTGFHELCLPPATWVVFDCRGPVPAAIQKGWAYLKEEWLQTYPFLHAPCPELEWYSSGNAYDDEYLSQIWIPILEEKE